MKKQDTKNTCSNQSFQEEEQKITLKNEFNDLEIAQGSKKIIEINQLKIAVTGFSFVPLLIKIQVMSILELSFYFLMKFFFFFGDLIQKKHLLQWVEQINRLFEKQNRGTLRVQIKNIITQSLEVWGIPVPLIELTPFKKKIIISILVTACLQRNNYISLISLQRFFNRIKTYFCYFYARGYEKLFFLLFLLENKYSFTVTYSQLKKIVQSIFQTQILKKQNGLNVSLENKKLKIGYGNSEKGLISVKFQIKDKYKSRCILYKIQLKNIMENIKNRDHLITLNHRAARDKISRSIKLGSNNRQKSAILTPISKITLANTQSILSSVSRKLQPQTISTISRLNDGQSSIIDKQQVRVTCMVDFDTVSLMSFISDKIQIKNFQQVYKNVKKIHPVSLIVDIHQNKKDKKGCFEQNCNVKKRWIKNVVFYERQIKNLMILKEKLPFINQKVLEQINKDVPRSFNENMFPKTKITVYHAGSQKIGMLQSLKTVLKLYAVYDESISYVQGINLIAASIITHVKQAQPSFIILKQLMNYGKLRHFYLNDFAFLKKEAVSFFHKHLKNSMYELYEHFMECNVEPLTLIPAYYTCLFSSIVDVSYMHIIIDQFFMQGVNFLHKLLLSLLLYLKDQLLISGEETLIKLGNTHLKSIQIPWGQVIEVTQHFKDL